MNQPEKVINEMFLVCLWLIINLLYLIKFLGSFDWKKNGRLAAVNIEAIEVIEEYILENLIQNFIFKVFLKF